MENISSDILFKILKHVPWRDRINKCELVNSRWNSICNTLFFNIIEDVSIKIFRTFELTEKYIVDDHNIQIAFNPDLSGCIRLKSPGVWVDSVINILKKIPFSEVFYTGNLNDEHYGDIHKIIFSRCRNYICTLEDGITIPWDKFNNLEGITFIDTIPTTLIEIPPDFMLPSNIKRLNIESNVINYKDILALLNNCTKLRNLSIHTHPKDNLKYKTIDCWYDELAYEEYDYIPKRCKGYCYSCNYFTGMIISPRRKNVEHRILIYSKEYLYDGIKKLYKNKKFIIDIFEYTGYWDRLWINF